MGYLPPLFYTWSKREGVTLQRIFEPFDAMNREANAIYQAFFSRPRNGGTIKKGICDEQKALKGAGPFLYL